MASTSTARGTKRVAIYVRVSSTGQEDNSSLATQEASCREYAQERGWDVVGVYRDVHTGGEVFERQQLSLLRAAVRDGGAEVVLAHALDRVSRNQAHLGFLLSEWDHAGCRLALVTEELDDTPEGRLLQSVRGFVAEVERLKIRERTRRGVRSRAESGKPLVGCRPPYGFRWQGDKKERLVPDPDRALVVAGIFAAVLRGETLRGIAGRLNAEGVPTPTGRGCLWAPSTLHRILSNPVYAGEAAAFRHASSRGAGGKRLVRSRPREEQVALPAGAVQAIVTPEQQSAVLARLEANRLRASRNNRDPEATLLRAGFARCGYCGSPLSVKHHASRGGAPSYRCVGTAADRYGCPGFAVSAGVLDPAVWGEVERVLRHPDVIAREVERRRAADPTGADLETLDRRLREVAVRQGRLGRMAAVLDDEDAAAPLLNELRSLGRQKRELEAERHRIEAAARAAEAEAGRLGDLAAWCGRVAANLAALTYDQKRLVLEALDVRVLVWRSDHEPRWRVDMSLPTDVPRPGFGFADDHPASAVDNPARDGTTANSSGDRAHPGVA